MSDSIKNYTFTQINTMGNNQTSVDNSKNIDDDWAVVEVKSLKNEHSNLDDNLKNHLSKVKHPKPSSSWGAWIGRGVLDCVNKFYGVKSSKQYFTEDKINLLRNKNPSPLPDKVANKDQPYRFSNEQLAKMTGFEEANVDLFPSLQGETYKDILFPHGEPRLSDIKQDPNLQDCWWLSSITAQLVQRGPESISRLFSESKIPDHVTVRLGTKLYDVPMGVIKDKNGEAFGSKSENWVQVLETAMMMHLHTSFSSVRNINIEEYRDATKMVYGRPDIGLASLQGRPVSEYAPALINHGFMSAESVYDTIKDQFKEGKAVVIGHLKALSSIRDGIAFGHAVTVIDVNDNGLKILDPYGKVKSINISALKDYSVYFD